MIDQFFEDPDPDRWLAEGGHTLGQFKSRFNRYRAAGASRSNPDAMWESEPDSDASKLIDQLAAADAAEEPE